MDTKSQQGLRALVPPPIEGGAQVRTPGKKRKGKGSCLELDPNTSYSFVLPYPSVSGNHAVKHARGRHYRTKAAEAYRTRVKSELARQGLCGSKWRPITRLKVRLWLCPPDERERDLDNVLKELKDAITKAGFWVNDSNRVILSWQIDWLPAAPLGAIQMSVSGWSPSGWSP